MPQINKVRIVNFQYNEGRRLIADELYDFSNENKDPSDVLINLSNGGGKSVLVQLMMQPIIPRAKVAGRRIESFFKKATDHCYVVIEWKLDSSSTKLMTGIAMAASDSQSDTDSARGFQVKYYTFISSYQNGQKGYDIVSLPLSRKENNRFIPAAFDDVRNLAKKPGSGIDRYSSDDSVKWQERLAEFGITQNEWHMIEDLNSNEDGLSKYFSEMRTSDAVIDKLIIPRIEEKQIQGSNRIGSKDDCSLDTMLYSHAVQFSKQKEIIKEREICSGFLSMLETAKTEAEELWNNNDTLDQYIAGLFAYADALNAEIVRRKAEKESITERKACLDEEIRHIRWEHVSDEYYKRRETFDRNTAELLEAGKARNAADARYAETRKALLCLECAHYYSQLRELENQMTAISEEISSRENNTESAEKLASLKYSAYLAIQSELERNESVKSELVSKKVSVCASITDLNKEIEALQKEIEKVRSDTIRFETMHDQLIKENDTVVSELGIEAVRMLDGKYQEEQLNAWQKTQKGKADSLTSEIESVEDKLRELDLRKETIPEEIAETNSRLSVIRTDIERIDDELLQYHTAEDKLKKLFERNGLDFAQRYTDYASVYLKEKIMKTDAEIYSEKRGVEAVKEEVAAVESGTLHIPKRISEYLENSGLHYNSVEQYLLTQQTKGTMSGEACLQLLERYPYAAYGVVMSPEDISTAVSEPENCWLPAVLPVFTYEDLEKMIRGEKTAPTVVAAYSKEYFRDRDSYMQKLQETLVRCTERIQMLEERMALLNSDAAAVSAFSVYSAVWESGKSDDRKKNESELSEQEKRVDRLRLEQNQIKERIQDAGLRKKQLELELNAVCSHLTEYEKLCLKLREEDVLETDLEKAEKNLHGKNVICNDKISENERAEKLLTEISGKLTETSEKIDALRRGNEAVSDAVESKLISGVWSDLLSQYEALLDAQNADLKRLNDDRKRLSDDVSDKQKEISKRGCEQKDFENLYYTESLEQEAAVRKQISERECDEADKRYSETVRSHDRAESEYNHAVDKLKEFGGEALPMNKVGSAFDERIADRKKQITDLDETVRQLDAKLAKLNNVQGKTENAVEEFSRPEIRTAAVLDEDFAAQLNALTKSIRQWRDVVSQGVSKTKECLERMAAAYNSKSDDIHRAVSSMQDLLSYDNMQGDKYFMLSEHITANMHTASLRISQIDTDLQEFKKSKDDLIKQCMIQGQMMYEGLQMLSGNSKVRVQGKRIHMLKFEIPDAVDDNVSRAAITAEIDKGTEEIAAKITEDPSAESEVRKLVSGTVSSKRLLRRYIGYDNIELKAYKIDRNPDNSGYRTWNQTQVNSSGAEKFVVYFAIILALMAYARDDQDEIGGYSRSVLILDNPFGPISSKHVLEPMFEISRSYHVQMICLSDISKSDILSCFGLVIRAVVKQFALSSKELLTHEGNESIEHGFYRSEQMNLF